MSEEIRINSYPSIYAIGHRAIEDIFKTPVSVEEKVDGSQYSLMRYKDMLYCRSKGTQIVLDNPEKMFTKAVETAKELYPLLHDGWVYRCEYLQKPKHNTLAYDRVPHKNLILFDVMIGVETYLTYEEKVKEGKRLGLETVPLIFQGIVTDIKMFNKFLETLSILGGTTIEGIVVKNYDLFTRDKKIALGKYVSERFKEIHNKEWKKTNPSITDILSKLVATYRSEARWEKAVQHLREAGNLDNSPKDIGALMKEVQIDIIKECEEEIKEILFKHFWSKVRRGLTNGLPEWYKQKLMEDSFK